MKILIICTGNSCRSQIAHGLMQSFDKDIEVYSAGTVPGREVNTRAISVMAEIGIDLSNHYPKSLEIYLKDEWEYVITVCAQAEESCPIFTGKVKHRIHLGYEDPSFLPGTEEFIMSEFRKLRDEMKNELYSLYQNHIKLEITT